MRSYFFDLLFSDTSIVDTEGSELPDLKAATTEARQIILEQASTTSGNERSSTS
jgi:hypothetical protein